MAEGLERDGQEAGAADALLRLEVTLHLLCCIDAFVAGYCESHNQSTRAVRSGNARIKTARAQRGHEHRKEVLAFSKRCTF